MIDRILALLVGGPVRSVIAGAPVVAPLAIWGGWPGLVVIAVGVVAATVWWRRQAWTGSPRPW